MTRFMVQLFILFFSFQLRVHAESQEFVTVRVFSKYTFKKAVATGAFRIRGAKNPAPRCILYAKNSRVMARCGNNTAKNSLLRLQNANSFFYLETSGMKRQYRGSLTVYAEKNQLVLLNDVSVEGYIRGTLKSEMPFHQPEALMAQAVVSRTWVYKNRHRHEHYDFCDLTHCQVYKGKSGEGEKVFTDAANKTKGMVLALPASETPADVFYHSTCGGKTTSAVGFKDVTSLSSVADAYCALSPHATWEFFLLKKAINKIFNKDIVDISVAKRDASGRVVLLALKSKGAASTVSSQQFYHAIGKVIGWNKLKSTWFEIGKTKSAFVFKGRGLGHGAGLCQWGAYFMAKEGKSYVDILKFYFPKLKVSHVNQN